MSAMSTVAASIQQGRRGRARSIVPSVIRAGAGANAGLRWLRALAALLSTALLMVAALPQLVAAQQGPTAADETALRGYVVNRQMLDKLVAFKVDADKLDDSEAGPADDEGNPESGDMPSSVDDLVRSVEKDPRATPLLRKHGLTAREYVIANLALMRAGLAVALGMDSPKDIEEAGTNKANLAFYRANKTAVDSLFADEQESDEPMDENDGAGAPAADDAPAGGSKSGSGSQGSAVR